MELKFPDNPIMIKAIAKALAKMADDESELVTCGGAEDEKALTDKNPSVTASDAPAPPVETVETLDAPPPPTEPLDIPQVPVDPVEGELDSAGNTWDERIHASSKQRLVKDGTWKLKRGIDKTYAAQILASQKTAAPPPPPPAIPVVNQSGEGEGPIITPPPPSSKPIEFAELMVAISKAGMTSTQINELCKSVGLNAPTELMANPQVYGQILEALEK